MRVLGIDTAGPVVSAALVSPEGTLQWSARVEKGADAQLLPAVAALLGRPAAPTGGEWEGDLVPGGVDLVAVSVGPGAFTGLRVGVAAALGVAMALGVRVLPLSSLQARAALVTAPRTLSVLDARKQRVYAALYDASGELPRLLDAERDLPPAEAWPPPPFLAVGEGAAVLKAAIEAAGGEVADRPDRPAAVAVARLGALLSREALDPGEVALRYLRAPDAQPPKDLGGPAQTR